MGPTPKVLNQDSKLEENKVLFYVLWILDSPYSPQSMTEIHRCHSQLSTHIGKKEESRSSDHPPSSLGDHFPHSIGGKTLELLTFLEDHRSPFPLQNFLLSIPAPTVAPLPFCLHNFKST